MSQRKWDIQKGLEEGKGAHKEGCETLEELLEDVTQHDESVVSFEDIVESQKDIRVDLVERYSQVREQVRGIHSDTQEQVQEFQWTNGLLKAELEEKREALEQVRRDLRVEVAKTAARDGVRSRRGSIEEGSMDPNMMGHLEDIKALRDKAQQDEIMLGRLREENSRLREAMDINSSTGEITKLNKTVMRLDSELVESQLEKENLREELATLQEQLSEQAGEALAQSGDLKQLQQKREAASIQATQP